MTEKRVDVVRPWYGSDNPLDALHDWMVVQLADLEARLTNPAVPDAKPETTQDESKSK